MKILEVALPGRPIYPEDKMEYFNLQHGAIEILISLLARGFVEEGHFCDVYSFGNSPLSESPFAKLSGGGLTVDWYLFNQRLLQYIQFSPIKYDVIHIHAIATAVELKWSQIKIPIVYTWHDPPTITWGNERQFDVLRKVADKYKTNIQFVAISNFQRDKLELNIPVVHNGLDIEQYSWDKKKSDRYLSVGRIVHDKGHDIAVDVAFRSGIKLDLIGNLYDRSYFDAYIKPRLCDRIVYHGPIYGLRKKLFFETCKGFLNTLRWEEPFGLTLVEALACGTPVIGFANGSVKEVVGNCGIFVSSAVDLREMLRSQKIPRISPQRCRERAEMFSYKRMVKEYLKIFTSVA